MTAVADHNLPGSLDDTLPGGIPAIAGRPGKVGRLRRARADAAARSHRPDSADVRVHTHPDPHKRWKVAKVDDGENCPLPHTWTSCSPRTARRVVVTIGERFRG